MYDCLIVGAGFAGSSAARILADAGKRVCVIDRRPHVGGNAFDEYDRYGVLVHRYGPHIFHTNSERVWLFLSRFSDWYPYEHRVLSVVGDSFYPFPINRQTLNAFFGLTLRSSADVESTLAGLRVPCANPLNVEDYVLAHLGHDLYKRFFYNYTLKQWGIEPRFIASGVAARIPYRENEEDRYFTDKYQGIPREGYTILFQRLLDHENINVQLSSEYNRANKRIARHVIFTGRVDEYFGFSLGILAYRSLRFEWNHFPFVEMYQPVGTVNYPEDPEYTRITEFKHLTGQMCRGTTIVTEYPQSSGEPFYPMPTAEAAELYLRYRELVMREVSVTFVGRLAQFRYYNMDQAVGAGIAAGRHLLD